MGDADEPVEAFAGRDGDAQRASGAREADAGRPDAGVASGGERRAFSRGGGVLVFHQESLSPELLWSTIRDLLGDVGRREALGAAIRQVMPLDAAAGSRRTSRRWCGAPRGEADRRKTSGRSDQVAQVRGVDRSGSGHSNLTVSTGGSTTTAIGAARAAARSSLA